MSSLIEKLPIYPDGQQLLLPNEHIPHEQPN